MDKQLLDEIIACLPRGRTLFHYHRDRYVLYLLEQLVRQGQLRTVADLKQSRWSGWLNKPVLKNGLGELGRSDVPLSQLLGQATAGVQNTTYLLSLGEWGTPVFDTWYQTSRPGHNLVLHLNLPLHHERQLAALGVDEVRWLKRWSHPNEHTRITLAWARIDLDFEYGQALVEEIQSDWLRDMPALFALAREARRQGQRKMDWDWMTLDVLELLVYEALLQQHSKIWSEAMLTATLWFLLEELGMREVFYHSWQTGIAVKRMPDFSIPPRSLYTELPERFGFARRNCGPEFLERNPKVKKVKKRQVEWDWYCWAA